MKKVLLSLFSSFIFLLNINAQTLTYKDVAGIFYKRCTSCHHEGSNMYSFMNYTKTNMYKVLIQNALVTDKMPPWKADTLYSRFMHERLISANEKANILNWIATGATMGDTTQAPPKPVYPPKYKLVGNADLTVTIPTFTSFATTQDIYVCFSMATNLSQDRIIRAYEIVPGNAPIVHHAVLSADSMGGYNGDMSGYCLSIPGNMELGAYAPGSQPIIFPSQTPLKTGIKLKAGSKVIIQMHYPKGSNGQVDSTKIRFYFYPPGETGVRLINVSTPLQNWNMNIPANTTQTFSAYYPTSGTLTSPISLFAVFPHSHKLGKSMLLYAVNPGIDTIPMVRINQWDFAWQDFYVYKKLLKIPAGYRLYAKHVFDNTTSNLNNPSNPPINVQDGFGTLDEMLFDGTMILPYQTGDELIDMEAIVNSDTLLASNLNKHIIAQPSIRSMAFPNPFTNDVKIKYLLSNTGPVSLEITDLLGKTIYTKNENKVDAGMQEFNWNGKSNQNITVPTGVYFITLKTNGAQSTIKLVKQ